MYEGFQAYRYLILVSLRRKEKAEKVEDKGAVGGVIRV